MLFNIPKKVCGFAEKSRAYVMRKRNSAYFTLGMSENSPATKERKQTIAARP